MPKYMVIHCKHAGCYDNNFIEHKETKTRFIPITINTPKIFVFDGKDEAREFFNEYMNDVDVMDHRCRNGNEVKHLEFCTCGVIDLDDEDHPNLFYNKNNQIFLLEYTAQMFTTNQSVRMDINNMNISNNLMRRCKSLSGEQRKKYIELGKMCEDCNFENYISEDEKLAEEKKLEEEKKKKEEEEDAKLIEQIKMEIERKIALEKKKIEDEKKLLEEQQQQSNAKPKAVKPKVVREKKTKTPTPTPNNNE